MARRMLLLAGIVSIMMLGRCAVAEERLLRPTLPDQFVVSTGTTIPFQDLDPVAQSGTIYFDRRNGQMRIDNFWLGTQRSFIVDVPRGRAHIINGGSCVTSVVTGQLKPVSIPDSAARDHDVNAVRGVNVDHFHHVQREDDLVHLDYFLRKSNVTVTAKTDTGEDTVVEYWVPWRVTSRRVERQEMIAAPERPNPNWRFFGEEVSEAIVRYGGDGRAVARLVRGVTVTLDFYNFVPMQPDPSVFEAPEALCSEAPSATFKDDLDLFQVQRDLSELSFNSEEGRRLMSQLWTEHDHSHELADEPAGKRSRSGNSDL